MPSGFSSRRASGRFAGTPWNVTGLVQRSMLAAPTDVVDGDVVDERRLTMRDLHQSSGAGFEFVGHGAQDPGATRGDDWRSRRRCRPRARRGDRPPETSSPRRRRCVLRPLAGSTLTTRTACGGWSWLRHVSSGAASGHSRRQRSARVLARSAPTTRRRTSPSRADPSSRRASRAG